MPLYEYKCQVCGPFEKWRRLDELDQPVFCHGPAQRVFSPPMILSSGRFPSARGGGEPRRVQITDRQASAPKHYSQAGGRPWMVSH